MALRRSPAVKRAKSRTSHTAQVADLTQSAQQRRGHYPLFGYLLIGHQPARHHVAEPFCGPRGKEFLGADGSKAERKKNQPQVSLSDA